MTSPDGLVEFAVTEQAKGSLTYGVTADTTTIFEESPLGIVTSTTDFTEGLSFVGWSSRTIDETYTLPAGTDPSYRDHANELVLECEKDGATLELILRATTADWFRPGERSEVSESAEGEPVAGARAVHVKSTPVTWT